MWVLELQEDERNPLSYVFHILIVCFYYNFRIRTTIVVNLINGTMLINFTCI